MWTNYKVKFIWFIFSNKRVTVCICPVCLSVGIFKTQFVQTTIVNSGAKKELRLTPHLFGSGCNDGASGLENAIEVIWINFNVCVIKEILLWDSRSTLSAVNHYGLSCLTPCSDHHHCPPPSPHIFRSWHSQWWRVLTDKLLPQFHGTRNFIMLLTKGLHEF